MLKQLVTGRVFAKGLLIASKDAFQILDLRLPSRARPVELIAELLQRHPLHRLLHCCNRLT